MNPIKHGDIVIESNTKKISVDGVGVPSAPLKGKFLQIYNMEGTDVVTKITFPAQASGFSFDFEMRGFNGTYPTYICRYSNGTEKKISFIRQTGTAKCVGLSGTEATGVDIVLPAKLYLFFYLDNIVAL
ncbi:hypothetical protein BJI69_15360 [Luteibacter rhizovicinus DSM 16549]|uniref:Uncharacterized protein n=1 Tax=Luteibacter rhizovicinus DSM 16549 TaxID=1440763 RepID=A0A0G9H5T9_9GAMM|nr:hypothetical protein BJI69_15360 [Luteibacter rhizovicinus DSM 16549]KLD65155.1 hypothetical protein Y883_16875 [Luteibacter rhizovicinus DSM 16549]KLD77123.1 hypothetical protein Y886_17470 [Xanthomonas hyacinthi DSM 19077]